MATLVYCALQIAGYLLLLLSIVLQQAALLPQVWARLAIVLRTRQFGVGCLYCMLAVDGCNDMSPVPLGVCFAVT